MLTNSCIASGHFAADSHELIAAVYVITFASMPGIKSSPPEAQRNSVLGQNFTLTISLQPRPQAKLPIPNYPVVTRCYLLANKAVKSHYCHGMPRGAKAQATRTFLHPVPTLSSETQEYWPTQNMKYRFEDLPLLVNLGNDFSFAPGCVVCVISSDKMHLPKRSANICKTSSHCPHLAHALIAALPTTTFASKRSLWRRRSRYTDCCQSEPLSHAPIAAPKVTTLLRNVASCRFSWRGNDCNP